MSESIRGDEFRQQRRQLHLRNLGTVESTLRELDGIRNNHFFDIRGDYYLRGVTGEESMKECEHGGYIIHTSLLGATARHHHHHHHHRHCTREKRTRTLSALRH